MHLCKSLFWFTHFIVTLCSSRLLNGNQLTGSLPEELGYLSNLDRIQIDQNQISGPIPRTFANLTKIKHLWVFFFPVLNCNNVSKNDTFVSHYYYSLLMMFYCFMLWTVTWTTIHWVGKSLLSCLYCQVLFTCKWVVWSVNF